MTAIVHQNTTLKRFTQRVLSAATILLFLTGICSGQETAGIGVALTQKDDRVLIGKLLPDGAAAASGQIHEGDWIIGVQHEDDVEKDVSKSDIQSVVPLVRGAKGTIVRLTIVPKDKELKHARTITLKRGTIAALERYGDGNLPKAGDRIPDISFTTLEDSSTELKTTDWRGRYIYLEIWTTWCVPCQHAMDRLQETARKYTSLKDKIAFVGVSADDTTALAMERIEKRNWNATANVFANEIAIKQLHVNAFPTAFLIDDRGVVIANSFNDNFEDEVDKLLKRLTAE